MHSRARRIGRHGNHKYTDEQIKEALRLYWNKGMRQRDIAKRLGMSKSAVNDACTRKRYAWVRLESYERDK